MKKSKRILCLVLAISLCLSLISTMPVLAVEEDSPVFPMAENTEPETPIYLDTSYSFAERAADLVARLTLEEKASQMISSKAPAIPRLGIESYGWWNEALHGVARLQYNSSGNATVLMNTTSYPINLSMGSTWDRELVYRNAVAISDEAREVVPDNRLSLTFWSPTINLARDPRWGRNDESYGEDVFLTTEIASQFVNGMEGKDMNGKLLDPDGYLKSVTTLKHYALNNSEVNRRNGSSDTDERSIREYYTAAFRNIVKKADVRSVMTSYNRVNGVPTTANVYLVDNLLRQTWGFSGYVTSDCDSIYDISYSHRWIPPGWDRPVDQVERMAFSLSAGVDLNCNAGYNDGRGYGNTLPTTVARNITTETGLFTEHELDVSLQRLFEARMQLGEFEDDKVKWVREARERLPRGTWVNSDANGAVTETPERIALAREIAAKSLVLLKNSETTKKDGTKGKLLPLQIPESGQFNVAVVGHFANPSSMYFGGYSSNQGPSKASKMVNPYQGIRDAILAVNPEATVTFYKGFTNTGTQASQLTTISSEHVDAAKAADLVIVYVGTDGGTANEQGDRRDLTLPGAQAELIKQIAQGNPNTVVVMETISMNEVTSFEPYVSAMLWSGYNGQQKGSGLADVLMGKYNPSGRLPFTWYQSVSQLGAITDYTLRPTDEVNGRTYMYFNGPVSYPFGYGLSYTTFEYSNLRIDKKELDANDAFQVSVDVKNNGNVAGADVVQLYVTTPDADPALERPIKRLKGFEKVDLGPGETKTVTMTVKVEDLAFFNEELGKYVVDNGRYGIQISRSSADADIQLQDYINVSGTLRHEIGVVTVKAIQEGDKEKDIPKRLLFDKNKVVIPQVTVAMNDETLYGYITKGKSKDLPEGMTVKYSSNRPSIVSVDENNVIRTTNKGGVATITATVTYKGISKSTDFIVYVKGDARLDGISIDGKPLDGFDKNTFGYAVSVAKGSAVPVVTAYSNDPDMKITIDQAQSVPGVATIVTNNAGLSFTYTIAFGYPPVSSDFKKGTLDEHWTILNPNAENYRLDENGLTINTQEGSITGQTVKNIFLQDAGGEWNAQTYIRFSASPSANYQQAGLIVYNDNNNYIRVVYERNSQNRVRMYKATNGVESQVSTANLSNQTSIYFRIVKKGLNYTAYYSTNGTTFNLMGTTSADWAGPKVGLLATNGSPSTAGSIAATFSYFVVYSDEEANPAVSSITVDGKPLAGFSPDETNYSVVLKKGDTRIPVVEAEADSSLDVEVTQASSIPGVATVKVSSIIGAKTYNITFGYAPTSDDFMDGTMDSEWKILNADSENYSLEAGKGLRLATLEGDIHQTGANWKNVFIRPAAGDWDVVMKVYYPQAPFENYQQIAMLVWQDDNNYIKMDCEFNSGLMVQFGREINGTFSAIGSDAPAKDEDGSLTLYYRIIKSGNTYTGMYSQDGVNYKQLGSPVNINLSNTHIGVFATKSGASASVVDTYCHYVKVLSPAGGVKIAGPDKVDVEKEFDVTLALENIPDNVYAADMIVNYDTDLFDFVEGGIIGDGAMLLELREVEDGVIRIILVNPQSIKADEDVLNLTFVSKKVTSPTTGNIAVEVTVGTSDGDEMSLQGDVLSITVEKFGIPGDVNGDGKVSIGDLAVAAYYYQAREGDPNWNLAKIADVTGDGIIDIEDFVFIAVRILGWYE